jgi:transmembrane sensor
MGAKRTHEIDAVASDWLIRRESGTWGAADQARLDEWLRASTLNRVAFLRLELAWEDAARLKALGAGIAGDRPPSPGHWNLTPFFDSCPPGPPAAFETGTQGVEPSPGPESEPEECAEVLDEDARGSGKAEAPRRRGRFFAVAATLLVASGLGAYVALAPHGDRYVTPVGGFASVPMADGSKVTLNTDSQIRIALTDTERRVELKHGEAFFEVSKDPNRPFVVRAGRERVIAVGTKFSVRREGDDIEVVVTEGKVRVENAAARQGARADGSADVFLTPGSIARAGESGVLVQRRTLPEAEEQLSWRSGVLMFRDQSLQEAVAEFNRYNERKIVIQDPAVASLKIEGNFRATNVEAFVRLLESGFPVRAEAQPDQIVLTAK